MNSFLEEYKKIEEEYENGSHIRDFENLKKRLKGKQVVLFGAAWIGDFFYKKLILNDIKVECFCDNFAVGVTPAGYSPIIKPIELKKLYPNAQVIISCDKAKDEIYNQLIDLGFSEEQIIKYPQVLLNVLEIKDFLPYINGHEWAYNFFEDEISKKIIISRIRCYLLGATVNKSKYPQYFEKGIYNLGEDEIFLDGGFFTGDTTEKFIEETHGKYKKIYGFEPDEYCRKKAVEVLRGYSNIEIVPKGLYSKETKVNFASTGGTSRASGGNIVEENGENVVSIPVTSIDNFFENKKLDEYPTFIKMDIEGSEKEALLGAEKVIRQVKPKLAICVYHKPEDIYELTKLIYSFNPNYKFTLRHYSNYFWETVLYAI